MSDPARHHPSGASESKSPQQHDGTGAMSIPPSSKSPPPLQHQTSSIALPTTLSNAEDLCPGAWPDGHPMSRARSDGDLKEITWLKAKVRGKKQDAFSIALRLMIDQARGRLGLSRKKEKKKEKKTSTNLKKQVDLLERQVAALIAVSPSSARTAVADAMSRIPSSVALNPARIEGEEANNNGTPPAPPPPPRPSSSSLPPRPPSQVFPSSSSTPPTLAETARPPLGEPVASEDGGGGAGSSPGENNKKEKQQRQQQWQRQQGQQAAAPASSSSIPPPMPLEPVPMSATRVVLHQLVTPTDVDDLGICSGKSKRGDGCVWGGGG